MQAAHATAPPLARRLGQGLIALACLAAAGGAWAQWQWKDANGRRIFSDTPPPASVPDKDILQRPRGMAPASPAPAVDEPSTTKPATAPTPPTPPVGDAKLEERKQQLDKAEADKRKAEEKAVEDKIAKARATNCDNARRNKRAIESGVRLATTNAQGEREFLDEAARASRLRETEAVIRENCR